MPSVLLCGVTLASVTCRLLSLDGLRFYLIGVPFLKRTVEMVLNLHRFELGVKILEVRLESKARRLKV